MSFGLSRQILACFTTWMADMRIAHAMPAKIKTPLRRRSGGGRRSSMMWRGPATAPGLPSGGVAANPVPETGNIIMQPRRPTARPRRCNVGKPLVYKRMKRLKKLLEKPQFRPCLHAITENRFPRWMSEIAAMGRKWTLTMALRQSANTFYPPAQSVHCAHGFVVSIPSDSLPLP
jgi:hypothetical protein